MTDIASDLRARCREQNLTGGGTRFRIHDCGGRRAGVG